MLNREKTWGIVGEEDDAEGFVPGLNTYHDNANVEITFADDPSLYNYPELDDDTPPNIASYADSEYEITSNVFTSIVGSAKRLTKNAPHVQLFTELITEPPWSLDSKSVFVKIAENYDSLIVTRDGKIILDNLAKDGDIWKRLEFSFSDLDFDLGVPYRLYVGEKEKNGIPYYPNSQWRLEIDLTDDCQYINITHVNPIEGENTFNFTVTAKGQNDAGKYVYDIHLWGWNKDYYYIEPTYNTFLQCFATEDMATILGEDKEFQLAEMACVGVYFTTGAKNFDFTETVYTDTTLHMAKYKDILKFNTTFDGTNWNPF